MYFDTHAHYDDSDFDNDREELLKGLPDAGIGLVVNPGCNLESSLRAEALAQKYPFIYAAAGFHPHDSKDMDENSISRLEALAAKPKVVAIGEIGLDYHYDYSPRDVQREWFRRQLELAVRVGLPVIIHEREATADCLEILRDFWDVRGVFHCFSGSRETAKIILDHGWYLSFTGVLTYKNAKKSREVVEWMPKDRLMLETDSPYMSPEPRRGGRNSSLHLPYIAEAVAAIWGISTQEAAEITTENGKRFFGIINP